MHRFEMHLDAGIGIVPARDMAQAGDRDRALELAVDSPREVEVELARNPAGIVIGGLEHGCILDQIHPDQEQRLNPVIGLKRQPHRAQQLDRGPGDHIADGRTGEEPQLGRTLHLRGKRDLGHEIGLDRINREPGKFGREFRSRLAEEIAGDVERDVGGRRDRREQQRGLDRTARAEFDHRAARTGRSGDLARAFGKDFGLGAGGIIFGDLRDVLE